MKSIFTALFSIIACSALINAQYNTPPNFSTQEEINQEIAPIDGVLAGITDPPNFDVRPMAEWEEIQSLIITWATSSWVNYPRINKNIARYAKEECEVIILSENPSATESYLLNNSAGGPLNNLNNITILDVEFDSVWGRDYGGHTCYKNDVEEAILVDWIYNRGWRDEDDATPASIANYKGMALYETTEPPYDLVATGGNFMSDGHSTAFSSELIFEENQGGYFLEMDHPIHTEEEIDDIVEQFMGIENYIKMDVLPYDVIHHIDMHMKILNEETIVVGEYPTGISDGPQIEANIEYVLSNHTTPWGTPYKIERIIQPPEDDDYPGSSFGDGAPRTYTNMVFVNNTVIVPVYEAQYDNQALDRLEELLPGYNIETIECNDIIQQLGAIHCITKAVGVDDPLWIAHDPVDDSYVEFEDQSVQAIVKHKDGIQAATMFYKTDITDSYTEVPMTLVNASESIYEATIPGQLFGTKVYYYINGEATTGKSINRPMPAPEGYFSFEFIGSVGLSDLDIDVFESIYPNPASAITVVPLNLPYSLSGRLYVVNSLGQVVEELNKGFFSPGLQKYFINAADYSSGIYNVIFETDNYISTEKLIVK